MNGWHNVSKSEPCPICQKPDWCNLSDDGCVAICHRVESPYLAKSGSGWIHNLRTRGESGTKVPRRVDVERRVLLDFGLIQSGYDADEILVEGLATTLGVDDEVLKAMDVRFSWIDMCWSFPMRDAEGRVTGLRYRELGGNRKWSARGSRDGLFFVPGKAAVWSPELVITEGPSDVAAALSLGLNAVGRSSCQTGAALLKQYVRRTRPRIATIISDNDAPGIEGAKRLAEHLSPQVPVRLLIVPHPHKDLRAWYHSNRLTLKVFRDIASAQKVTITTPAPHSNYAPNTRRILL